MSAALTDQGDEVLFMILAADRRTGTHLVTEFRVYAAHALQNQVVLTVND
jgi:hypothetical protein